jgi:hypothetical protein
MKAAIKAAIPKTDTGPATPPAAKRPLTHKET